MSITDLPGGIIIELEVELEPSRDLELKSESLADVILLRLRQDPQLDTNREKYTNYNNNEVIPDSRFN